MVRCACIPHRFTQSTSGVAAASGYQNGVCHLSRTVNAYVNAYELFVEPHLLCMTFATMLNCVVCVVEGDGETVIEGPACGTRSQWLMPIFDLY